MKFEYKVVVRDKFDEEFFNKMGEENWEFVWMRELSGFAPRILFKRPKLLESPQETNNG